jgi:hypothetical protein
LNNSRRIIEARIRSSLAGVVSSGTDLDEMKKNGWKEHGIFVIDIRYAGLNNAERAFLENLGAKVYGKRHDR